MIPLETLDQYMTTCIAACVMYAFFMLFLLVCFLRKFNNSDSINSLVCPPPIELHTVTNPYRYSSVSQNPQISTYMQPSRSNRSCTSSRQSSNVYKVQLKKVPFGGIDMSQMERLATLPEENSSNPLQIFTLAHAVRPSKKLVVGGSTSKTNESVILNERKTNKLLNNSISQQVKETFTIKYEAAQNSQLRSRLPLNMIVSKMATRKPAHESDCENEDPYRNIDVSLCRKIKLAPPSWRNKSNQTKRFKPNGFTKIVDNMKEKCSQLNVSKQQGSRIISKDRRNSDLNHLLADVTRSARDEMTTSILEYNYNKLYGQQQGQRTLVKCRDEDPLPDDFECKDSESLQEESSAHRRNSTTDDFEFNPQCSSRPDEPTEFVWNPVIMMDSQSKRLFTSPQERTRDDHLSQNEYLRQTRWRPPSHDHYYPTNHPPCLDSPYSPGNCETSSTSSGHTVAEERLQFILYATRGSVPQFDIHYTEMGQDSSSARFLWPNANSSFRKFLEE